MSAPLSRLLQPRSIAVVGGGIWCENVVRQCQKMGFSGPVWPVHPDRDVIADEKVWRHVGELPAPPDATFIGVNRRLTIEIMRSLARRKAGGAVCFAAGFSEAQGELEDGTDLQSALLDAAQGMPFIGPNCYGFINYLDGALLWPDQHGGQRVEAGVAIVTQSSNIAINMTMQARGLPLAYVVTAGNQAQQDLADIGAALLQDDRVTALGLHIEGISDLRAMEYLALLARKLGKAVVVLKVGASDAARTATISHTASMAGSDTGADALFRRLGLRRAPSLSVFLEALKIAHCQGPLTGPAIASMSCSGGEASLMADMAAPLGLHFPALDAAQTRGLGAVLGPMVKLANPLDYNTYIWPDTDRMAATFTAMMQGALDLGIVVLDFPRADRCSDAQWAHVVDAVAKTRDDTGKPMAVLASLPETLPEHWAQDMMARGIIPLCGMVDGLAAVAVMARGFGCHDHAPLALPRHAPKTRLALEVEAKAILRSAGLPVPRNAGGLALGELAAAADDIGFPLVLKAEGLAHKTEAGGVALGITDRAALLERARAMAAPRYLIETEVTRGVGEVLLAVTTDPAHGLVMTIGAGGIWTEILADTAHLLLPVTRDDLSHALQGLRIAPLLRGYRGQARADVACILDIALRLQELVLTHEPPIVEVEINPLIVCEKGAWAVDALIILETENDG